MDEEGFVYVCELGNHRIQKFTSDGQSVSVLGGAGRAPGQFHQPWGFAFDSTGAMHVIDSYNHRVQRFDTI
jgi:DNA-binding beta-propeller fold protein YncE